MSQTELNLQFEAIRLPKHITSTLQNLYEKGYRYIAQDKGLDTVCCFSLKPRKYSDLELWGYENPDASGVLPAYPIHDTEIPGIMWSNRSATLIEIYLGVRA